MFLIAMRKIVKTEILALLSEEICLFSDVSKSKSKEVLIVHAVSFLFPFTIQFLKISIEQQLLTYAMYVK